MQYSLIQDRLLRVNSRPRKTKAKAEKDGGKLRDLLKRIAFDPQHRNKAIRGIFLTQHEPTADQRDAIKNIARQCNLPIDAIGYLTLRRALIT